MHKETLRIILASASPRRRELLHAAGVAFEVKSVDVDESQVRASAPEKLVMDRALLKAEAAAATLADEAAVLVIGADTAVVLDGELLGKPRDPADARSMLGKLSDRSHRVITGVAVCPAGNVARPLETSGTSDGETAPGRIARVDGRLVAFQQTEVTMGPLTPETIETYVATGEPLDKAGAYGIQERGGLLVRRIVGDYFNVVGLPLALLRDMLSFFGVELLGRGQD